MLLTDDTYIVLEMPVTLVEQVMSLRQRFSPKLLTFPVEITVAGSSGVGPVAQSEELERVIPLVNQVASRTDPFAISFNTTQTFPGSGLYYYDPEPKIALEGIHLNLLATGIRFTTSEYPFTPHLTVIKVNAADSAVVRQVENLPSPSFNGLVDTMAIYSVRDRNCSLLHRIRLGSQSKSSP